MNGLGDSFNASAAAVWRYLWWITRHAKTPNTADARMWGSIDGTIDCVFILRMKKRSKRGRVQATETFDEMFVDVKQVGVLSVPPNT